MTQRTALFVSPHLDDAVFSCGGLAALLSDAGWHTVLATVFTRSVVPAEGFALACQLDKGLPADADYMALRRREDLHSAALLGFTALHWLDLPEAPHRGYGSAPALFGTVAEADHIARPVADALSTVDIARHPSLVLVPQGLGAHVDHQVVVQAALQVFARDRLAFYRDAPYAMRQPDGRPLAGVPVGPETTIPIARVLERKISASAAYASQIGFQFGGKAALEKAMAAFALSEGGGVPAERLTGTALECCIEDRKQAVLF